MNVSISVPKLTVGFENPVIRTTLNRGVIRPDAELIRSYAYDRYIVRDEGVTLPQSGSSITQLKASEVLSPTIEFDDDYYYYILVRALSIPVYNTNTDWQGREEYSVSSQLYELVYFPSGTFKSLNDGTECESSSYWFNTAGGMTQQILWTSDGRVAVYDLSAYGATQVPRMPTISGQTIYISSPSFQLYGSASFFHDGAVTDIRFQYMIDVWRVLKESMNMNGWGVTQELEHGIQCAQSEDHKLT